MKELPRPNSMKSRKGFSLLELIVVVGILLAVAAMSIPNMMSVVANARLHAGLTNVSGVLQNCRMLAVKQNRTMTARITTERSGIIAYIKAATDKSGLKASDPQVQWEAPIRAVDEPTGVGAPSALDSDVLGFKPETGAPSFNSRGLPCVYDSGSCPNKGFVYYFKDTRQSGRNGWAAISISPAGRIKKWFWNGSAWSD